MEDKERKQELHDIAPQAEEQDYNANEQNPGPSKEAIEEKDEDGAGKAMKWIIPVIIVALLIVWFFFFRTDVTQ